MDDIRVMQYGLGYIGCSITRLLVRKKGFEVVGAVDISPEKAGRDLGEVIGAGKHLGIKVEEEMRNAIRSKRADVVIHTTQSRMQEVKPQLEELIKQGLNVISTAEELSFPYLKHPQEAAELDRLAKGCGVAVLGAGVNPGFVLDLLILVMSGVCQDVRAIRGLRVVNASTRRRSFQQKVALGETEEGFRRGLESHVYGHVGLAESAALIADGLGFRPESVRESASPLFAERDLETSFFKVPAGRVKGLRQSVDAVGVDAPPISLTLEMYAGAENPRDSIIIEGPPRVDLEVKGGIAGDEATASLIVNWIPRLVKAQPGLLTVKDLPPPMAFLGHAT